MNSQVSFWMIFLAILAAAIEPVIAKLAYACQVTPVDLMIVKAVIGSIVILPITRIFTWVGVKGFVKICAVSLLLLATNFLTLLALEHLSAVMVITILTTTPAIVGIVNQALGKVNLNLQFWFGFGLCFLGILLGLDYHNLALTWIGLVQIGLAVLSSTTYRVYLDKLTKEFPVILISTYIFLINGLIMLLFYFPKLPNIQFGIWQFGIWLGITSILANIAFLYALNKLGSTRISVILMIERPVVLIIAALVLKEVFNIEKFLGIIMVLWGISLARVQHKP